MSGLLSISLLTLLPVIGGLVVLSVVNRSVVARTIALPSAACRLHWRWVCGPRLTRKKRLSVRGTRVVDSVAGH
jgi:hypothetical protein